MDSCSTSFHLLGELRNRYILSLQSLIYLCGNSPLGSDSAYLFVDIFLLEEIIEVTTAMFILLFHSLVSFVEPI